MEANWESLLANVWFCSLSWPDDRLLHTVTLRQTTVLSIWFEIANFPMSERQSIVEQAD
jgi:hypothetical protein